jgi:predicted RND superfamily exporter protein
MGLGLMGFTGIKLDINTIMIASMSIGIAVDDTIHFITRYKHELLAGASRNEAQKQVLISTGRAIVFTSLNLTGGFLIACVSDFKPQIFMGIIGAFCMIIALIGNLTVLPAALMIFKPRFAKKNSETQNNRISPIVGV